MTARTALKWFSVMFDLSISLWAQETSILGWKLTENQPYLSKRAVQSRLFVLWWIVIDYNDTEPPSFCLISGPKWRSTELKIGLYGWQSLETFLYMYGPIFESITIHYNTNNRPCSPTFWQISFILVNFYPKWGSLETRKGLKDRIPLKMILEMYELSW